MKYCWQHPDWPQLIFDEAPSRESLYNYAKEAGRLAGAVAQLQESQQYEAALDLMVSEAIKTSQIEGERLDQEDVRSSLKNYLGLNATPVRVLDPRAEGIAALMVDVRKTFKNRLTPEMLFHWHRLVIPDQTDQILGRKLLIGQWRRSAEPMQMVSGPLGYETVHYEAPPADRVGAEMDRFLHWHWATCPLNPKREATLPGPVRAAVAHLWFEVIHPFDDGNGRVGRTIAEQVLAQDMGHPPLLSLSTTIEQEHREYYQRLKKASRADLNITAWVTWFSDIVLQSQIQAVEKVEFVLSKARFWDKHRKTELNNRQQKVLNKIFQAGAEGFIGGMSAKKYISITGCSKATATRDLTDLVSKGCLYRLEGGGRSARYGLNLRPRDKSL